MNEYTYIENFNAEGNLASVSRSDGAWIPANPTNRDYQEYLKSLEETA
jgi:hypothetical protein